MKDEEELKNEKKKVVMEDKKKKDKVGVEEKVVQTMGEGQKKSGMRRWRQTGRMRWRIRGGR